MKQMVSSAATLTCLVSMTNVFLRVCISSWSYLLGWPGRAIPWSRGIRRSRLEFIILTSTCDLQLSMRSKELTSFAKLRESFPRKHKSQGQLNTKSHCIKDSINLSLQEWGAQFWATLLNSVYKKRPPKEWLLLSELSCLPFAFSCLQLWVQNRLMLLL